MKRIFLATGLLFFIFQLLSAQKTIRIYPTDDTYIHGGNNKAKYDRVQGLDDPLQLKVIIIRQKYINTRLISNST